MADQPIRILLLLHELTLTGAPRSAVEIFSSLKASGEVDVFAVALEGGPLEADLNHRQMGGWVLSGAGKPLWQRAVRVARRKSVLRSLLARLQPDVIYVNSAASLTLAATLGLPETGIPAILHVHELETHLQHYAIHHPNLLTTWPTRYVTVSKAVQDALHRDYRIPCEKMVQVYPFVRMQEVPETVPEPSLTATGPFVVGGCGKGMWRKGMEAWLRMAKGMTRRMGRDAVRFVWVGVSNDGIGHEFRETARKFGIAEVVECVPPTKEPLTHFARFDAFAMTSWEDPCPAVVMEAMVLCKPVACFNGSGGSPEMVGDTGLIIEEFDTEAMAEDLTALANDRARLRTLGIAARRRVLAEFTPDVQIPRLRDEIRRVAEGKSG